MGTKCSTQMFRPHLPEIFGEPKDIPKQRDAAIFYVDTTRFRQLGEYGQSDEFGSEDAFYLTSVDYLFLGSSRKLPPACNVLRMSTDISHFFK